MTRLTNAVASDLLNPESLRTRSASFGAANSSALLTLVTRAFLFAGNVTSDTSQRSISVSVRMFVSLLYDHSFDMNPTDKPFIAPILSRANASFPLDVSRHSFPFSLRPLASSSISVQTPSGSSDSCCQSIAGIVPAALCSAIVALNAPAAIMSSHSSTLPKTEP